MSSPCAGKPRPGPHNRDHQARDCKLEQLVAQGFTLTRAAEILDGKDPGAYEPNDRHGGSGSGPRRSNPRTAPDPKLWKDAR